MAHRINGCFVVPVTGSAMSEDTPSFSIRSIFNEAAKEFGSPDRGFIRTTWLMITAPGNTLRKILSGEEKNVTSPFRYFLLAYTLYGIVYVASGANDILFADAVAGLKHAYSDYDLLNTDEEIRERLGYSFYLQYPLVSTLLMLVLLWLASIVSFFRFQLSLGQRLSFTLYFFGSITVLQLPLVIFIFLHKSLWTSWASIFIIFCYMLWSTHTYNKSTHRFGFARGLIWFVVWGFLQFILMMGFTFKAGVMEGIATAMKEKQSAAQEATKSNPP
jgi:hypothetical protein